MRRNGRPRSKHRLQLRPAGRDGQALGLSKPSPVPCRSRKRRNGRPRSKHRLQLPPAGRDGQAFGLSEPSPVPYRSRKRLTLRHRESRRFPRRDQTPQDILGRGRLRACHRDSVNANFRPHEVSEAPVAAPSSVPDNVPARGLHLPAYSKPRKRRDRPRSRRSGSVLPAGFYASVGRPRSSLGELCIASP